MTAKPTSIKTMNPRLETPGKRWTRSLNGIGGASLHQKRAGKCNSRLFRPTRGSATTTAVKIGDSHKGDRDARTVPNSVLTGFCRANLPGSRALAYDECE